MAEDMNKSASDIEIEAEEIKEETNVDENIEDTATEDNETSADETVEESDDDSTEESGQKKGLFKKKKDKRDEPDKAIL